MAYIVKKQETKKGTNFSINNLLKVNDFKIYGDTSQDGTPTPSEPINVETVTGLQNININGNDYKLNLGKNLFNKNTATILNAYLGNTVIASDNNNRTTYCKCEPNKTYTISKIAGQRFKVAYTYTQPALNTNIYGAIQNNNASSITITTDNNAKYLVVWYYNSNDDINADDMLNTLQVEQGSTATPYSNYFEPIELCKIGNYQDYIYKQDDKWYIHKEIGKIVLDGTETGWNTSSLNVPNYKSFYINRSESMKQDAGGYSNNFQYKTYNNWTGLLQDEFFEVASNSIGFRILQTTVSDLASFKTWLSNNNTSVYYVLPNSTNTEITNSELIEQLNNINLITGDYELETSSLNLPVILYFDYYCKDAKYYEKIYSGDSKHKIKIWFNNVELENADLYCEKLTLKKRILPEDGNKRFSLDNFVSQEIELILHRIDSSIIKDQVRISIGTLVNSSSLGDEYQYVPIGIFNIQDTPVTDKDKITLTLRDNRVKFDFAYNAEPLIERKGGSASKMEILLDMCEQAGVVCNVQSFLRMNEQISIYDNTITATTYVSYLAEQAGMIATIDRNGYLIFVNLKEAFVNRIPLSIVEKYELGEKYQIKRVVFEDGIIKYETSNDETLDTLYLDGANPYVVSQYQVNSIFDIVRSFEIDSLKTGKILGDPAIDAYDIVEIYNDYEENEPVIAKTLANQTLTYNGVLTSEYNTEIGIEERTSNVSLTGEATFKKYAKTEIDNLNNSVRIVVGEVNEQNEKISTLEQSVGELSSEISEIAELTTTLYSYNATLHFTKVNASEPLRLEVHPTNLNNIAYTYPHNTQYPNNTLYPTLRTVRFENLDTGDIVDYEIPEDLYYYDAQNYDSFILDYRNHRCYIKKRCWVDNNGQVQLSEALYPDYELYPENDLYPVDYIKEIEYPYPTINLTNGDYNVYLIGYSSGYILSEIMFQNKYTTQFATHAELHSAIDQTADEIKLEVSHKVDEDEIKSYFDITAESITAKTGKFAIDADNFKLEEDGTVTATKGTISKFEFDDDKLSVDLTLPYDYTNDDIARVQGIINGTIQPEYTDYEKYDFIQNHNIDSVDLEIVQNLVNETYSKTSTYTLDTTNPIKALSIENGSTNTNIGAYSSYIDTLISDYINVNNLEMTDYSNSATIEMKANDGSIKCVSLTQTSLAKIKKNFEKLDNGLEIIKDIDIYKYNLKDENDEDKKHIGLVIGDDFKYSKEVTSKNNDSVDIYSLLGVCVEAIKELNAKVEYLENKLKKESD